MLQLFECERIAQDTYWVAARSLGEPVVHEHYSDGCSGFCYEGCITDLVQVQGINRHHVVAEEWEGVQRKIVCLLEDMEVTRQSYWGTSW